MNQQHVIIDHNSDEVFDKFGYFGVSCFTTLSKNNQIKFNEKILKNILDYYVKNFEVIYMYKFS